MSIFHVMECCSVMAHGENQLTMLHEVTEPWMGLRGLTLKVPRFHDSQHVNCCAIWSNAHDF